MNAADVPTPPEQDENRNACGPHCGHWDDIQELDTLRKALQAVTDQRDTLLAVVRELRAEIGRMERGQ